MSLLLDAIFSSVALSHLIVDIMNGMRAVLLAYLSGPLGLTNAVIGIISTLCGLTAALIQPFSGFFTDRFGPRWVVTGGVFWMGLFFILALTIPGSGALIFLVLASLGSGAFHPAGAMQATLRGHTHFSGRETTAASYFFVFGELGYFFGPLIAGPILDRFGPVGLLAVASPFIPIGFNASRRLMRERIARAVTNHSPTTTWEWLDRRWPVIACFALMAACQSWAQSNITTFVPKYLSDLGTKATIYGLVSALFMGGSALGNVSGGILADRIGKRRVAVNTLALGSVPLFLIPLAGQTAWLYLVVFLGGLLTGAVQSIMVVHAQHLIPAGRGLASGLIMGFLFSTGALGTMVSGYMADQNGFTNVFFLSAGLALCAAVFAMTIERKQETNITTKSSVRIKAE